MSDLIDKAKKEAESSSEVTAAAKAIEDAYKELAADPENKDLQTAVDEAVHAHATAMSAALIDALLAASKDGGRRRTRRGRKVRRTRKSRR